MISKEDIVAAHSRIQNFIHRTPVLTNNSIDGLTGLQLFFKCENFQKIGAFKIRGAMNAALTTPTEKINNGFATHSSGNHAQALAYAARQLKTKAYIVMPENSPKVKVDAVRGYGATITFCEATQAAREAALNKIVERTGAEFIHPYNDTRVIAGQATAAKELIEDVPELEIIIAPVGGGGLLSGTGLAAAHFSNQITVIGAEPEGAADAVLSFKSGQIETAPFIKSIADGLLTKLGDHTLPLIRKYVHEISNVSDDQIIAAMRIVYERMKIVIEPSAAVSLAVAIKERAKLAGKKVGVIFSGGNVDLGQLSNWMKTN